ncbi:MAG: nucleoside hydrolase [Phycisphaerae bacterium]
MTIMRNDPSRRRVHPEGQAVAAVLLAVVLGAARLPAAEPVAIIYDTDMAGDVDDVGALAVLHALADAGEARILGCMISAPNEWVGPCLDAVNTYYGRPDVPIGNVCGFQNGYPKSIDDRPIESKYTRAIAEAFPHDLKRSTDAPPAVTLYRKLLAEQPDASVTIVSVGFLSNLKALLDSSPDQASPLTGEELVKKKVKLWVCMGGKFPDGRFAGGGGEYNVTIDTAAAVRAVNDWPTPVVFSGFEIGARIKVGSKLAGTPERNPVRAAYLHYNALKPREAWDLTAVLFAVRGQRDYWTLSEPGLCLMHAGVPHGHNEWIPAPGRRHRYLIEKMPPAELADLIEELVIRPPRNGPK